MPELPAILRGTACLLALCSFPIDAAPPQREPGGLVDKTLATTGNLRDLGPFRLIARIETTDAAGEKHPGAYSLIAAAADRWREESLIPGRESLRVANVDTLWIKRSINHEQPAMLLFHDALDSAARIKAARAHVTAAGLHDRRIGKIAASCFSATRIPDQPEIFCADPSTGVLIEERRGEWRVRYSEHVRHGERFFPRSIQVFRAGRMRLDAWVMELDVDPAVPAYLFEPVEDAEAWPWCPDRNPPRLIRRTLLESTSTSVGRSELKVYSAYALVSPEGRVERLRLLTPATEELRPAIVEALGLYRFQPATCGETAVPYELAIDATFEGPG